MYYTSDICSKKLFTRSFCSPSDSEDETCDISQIIDPDDSEDIEILICNGASTSDTNGQFSCLLPQGTNATNYFSTTDGKFQHCYHQHQRSAKES